MASIKLYARIYGNLLMVKGWLRIIRTVICGTTSRATSWYCNGYTNADNV